MSGLRAAAAAFSQGIRRSFSVPSLSSSTSTSDSSASSNEELKHIDSRELVLPPGQQISDKELNKLYELAPSSSPGSVLGRTSSAVVRLAVEHSSGEVCALKIVERSSLSSSPSLLATLRLEASLAGRFELQPHPNVCMPIKVYETRTRIVVELDAVPGGDLTSFLTSVSRPTLKWLDDSHPGRVLVQLLRAVEFCHRHRLVHGDVKPDNVLLTRAAPAGPAGSSAVVMPGCIYKLADFGFCHSVPPDAVGILTGGGVGTVPYAAPEVKDGPGTLSFASDMWSVGVTAYVLLTGELPVEPEDREATKRFYEDPENAFKLLYKWKKISRKFRRFILGLVVVNPAERLTVGAALEAECLPGREGRDDDEKPPSEKSSSPAKSSSSSSRAKKGTAAADD